MELSTALIIVAVLVLFEAFFSGSEIGMISVNRIRMQQLAVEGNRSARLINNLLATPEQLFATTSFGTNLCVVSSTAVFTAFLVSRMGEWGDIFAMLILSPFILFVGEIIPKLIFQNRPDAIMQILVYPLNVICKFLSPFNAIFTAISNFIRINILGNTEPPSHSRLSRDELRQVSHPGSETSDLEPDERKMIHKIFNFGELSVEQVMVPLVQMYALPDTATLDEANNMAKESGFSRLPVFHDRMFNLIGVVNTFDLLTVPQDDSPISELIRPAYYIPPNKKLDDLLDELQQRGLHLAVVVDEYGGCIGIITVEDLLEQIVGEIEDEYDEPPKYIEDYDNEGYLIQGDTEINVINEELDYDLPEGDYETLAGLMIDRLERIPAVGDQVNLKNCRLTVKEAGKRKINSVILRKHPEDYEETKGNGKSPENGKTSPDRNSENAAEKPNLPSDPTPDQNQ